MENVMHSLRCPICNNPRQENPRYPNAVCPTCAEQATDERGRLILFYNESMSGGFRAEVKETGELYNSHICYVNGVKCWAEEAHMGGIVIAPIE
jgi:hypothetical protein